MATWTNAACRVVDIVKHKNDYRVNGRIDFGALSEPIFGKDKHYSATSVRKAIYGIERLIQLQENDTDAEYKQTQPSVSYGGGNTTYSGIIALPYGEQITPELVMKAHNISPAEWHVVAFTSNFWQNQGKDGQLLSLYQSKITVRPKAQTEITYSTIDNYFANRKDTLGVQMPRYELADGKEILEIDYTDAHIGLLSWGKETGTDYDLDIARERFLLSIADTVERAKRKNLSKIIFATLGDILHIDNDKNETTKGTPQQADGRIQKIFDCAVETIEAAINALLSLGVPIEYIYTAGNHDTNTGYFLAKCIQTIFASNPNITFDISPNPQKAKVIGATLVGFTHGDMPTKNIGTWLQQSYREEYGRTKYAEVHSGHLHDEMQRSQSGVMVRHLPSLCVSSAWEHQQGYNATRGLMCFVWDETKGLRETWYNYI